MSQWKRVFDGWLTPYLSIWYTLSHLLDVIKIYIVTYFQQYCHNLFWWNNLVIHWNDDGIIIFVWFFLQKMFTIWKWTSYKILHILLWLNSWFKCIVTLRSKIECFRWNHKVIERTNHPWNNLKFEFEHHKWFHIINSLLHWVENIFRRYSA